MTFTLFVVRRLFPLNPRSFCLGGCLYESPPHIAKLTAVGVIAFNGMARPKQGRFAFGKMTPNSLYPNAKTPTKQTTLIGLPRSWPM